MSSQLLRLVVSGGDFRMDCWEGADPDEHGHEGKCWRGPRRPGKEPAAPMA